MADKNIGDLTQAESIGNEDLFVLQQNGEAKKLKGSQLIDYVTFNVISITVETLPAGSQATATYNEATGTLSLGIPQGEQGNIGPANTLTIGTVTSGAEASATITGEAPNQVLNLVLQQGEKGDSGVYVGAGDMPEGYNVQIDPSGSGDEIVTAENIQSALGYTPANSADLANKLPKSPADWEPWTAEEQAAARDRIGIDKPFELIEEIVCDGEATAYTRTVDVNGNPYNLLSVYIEFEIETGNSYTSSVFFRAYDAESNTVLYDGSSVNQKNYVSYLLGGVDATNGMYQGWITTGNIASYNSGGSNTKRINRRAPIISPIKKIYIMVGGGLKFLSGDKIRIYGVRA